MSVAKRLDPARVSDEPRDATWAALRAQLRMRNVELAEARQRVEQLEEENRRLRQELEQRRGR